METLYRLGEQYFTASVHGSALIIAVLALQFFFRNQLSAKWRFALWLPVVLRLVLPVVPSSPFSVMNLASREQIQYQTLQSPAKGEAAKPVSPSRDLILPAPFEFEPAPAASKPQTPVNWTRAAILIWCAGAGLVCGFFLYGLLKLRKVIKRATQIDPPQSFKESAEIFGVTAPVGLYESGEVDSPGLAGMLRPKILLPRLLSGKLGVQELKHIFLHEFAHIKRGDLWMNAMLLLVQALHWFNPLVWFAIKQMKADMEMACDEHVLARLGENEAANYGCTILKLMQQPRLRFRLIGFVGIVGRAKPGTARIKRIAGYKASPRSNLVAPVLLTALFLAGVSTAQTPPPHDEGNFRKNSVNLQTNPIASATLTNSPVLRPNQAITRAVRGAATFSNDKGGTWKKLGAPTNGPARPSREAIVRKIPRGREGIILKAQVFRVKVLTIPAGSTLEGAVKRLDEKVKEANPTQRGLNFLVALDADKGKTSEPFIFPRLLSFTNSSVLKVLEAFKAEAKQPNSPKTLNYSFSTSAVVFSSEIREAHVYSPSKTSPSTNQTAISTNAPPKALSKKQVLAAKLGTLIINDLKIPEGATIIEAMTLLGEVCNSLARNEIIFATQSDTPTANSGIPALGFKILEFKFPKTIHLRNISVKDGLDQILKESLSSPNDKGGGLYYSIEDYAVLFAAREGPEPEQLYTRRFKLGPNEVKEALDAKTRPYFQPLENAAQPLPGEQVSNTTDLHPLVKINNKLRQYLEEAGVKFEQPLTNVQQGFGQPQKSLFYNDRTGVLLVRASLRDLDLIENAVSMLNATPPLVSFDVILVYEEAGGNSPSDLWNFLPAPGADIPAGNNIPSQVVNAQESLEIFRAIKNRPGLKTPAYSRVVIPSGSQSISTLSGEKRLPAFSVELLPRVMPGGITINLAASLRPSEEMLKLEPVKIPPFKVVHRVQTQLRDGSTLIIAPVYADGASIKQVYLITPTLIDPAGNRIHKE